MGGVLIHSTALDEAYFVSGCDNRLPRCDGEDPESLCFGDMQMYEVAVCLEVGIALGVDRDDRSFRNISMDGEGLRRDDAG